MINGELQLARPLRWGMVGGGRTGQVGYKHRTGALRDGTYHLVCGAFDVDAARGRDFGMRVGVAEERCYDSYQALIAAETARADGVEVVSVATPNFTHYEITKALLSAGIHVICEKPLFFSVAECDEIAALAREKGLIVGVTYGYTGHPMVAQMAAMVAKGMLGEIRIVDMQYTHGFNAGDDTGASEAQQWRVDPARSGGTFVLGDIGTHLQYLSEIVLPHLKIEKLLCDRTAFIPSRAPLEDHATVLMHYDNGARARLWVSSVDAGQMDAQRYRFVGAKASVEWHAARPDELLYEVQGEPSRILHHGMPYLEEEGHEYDRMGALHTEGLGDSWANIYLWIAQAIAGNPPARYPDMAAGTSGVRWLENCIRSAEAGGAWVDYA
ncbi:Gfo/Idh/MocA family oxidoreductase [Thioclava sp. GXIMD2076]